MHLVQWSYAAQNERLAGQLVAKREAQFLRPPYQEQMHHHIAMGWSH